MKWFHKKDGVLREIDAMEWMFLSTDMAIVPEQHEGEELIQDWTNDPDWTDDDE